MAFRTELIERMLTDRHGKHETSASSNLLWERKRKKDHPALSGNFGRRWSMPWKWVNMGRR